MAKSDFEFYSLGENLPEFVIPAPASDPYNGEFKPLADIASLVVDLETIGGLFGEEGWEANVTIENNPSEANLADSNLLLAKDIERYKQAIHHDYAHNSLVTVSAELPADIEQEQTFRVMNSLYEAISYGRPLAGIKPLREIHAELPDEIRGKIQYFSIPDGFNYEYPYLTNEKGEPKNPYLTFAEALQQRVYEWRPGPERKSSTGEVLLPTFSPRPVTILSVCSVKIELINPALAN